MTNGGFSGKQFTTAARRRGGVPLKFSVADWDDEQGEVDVELRVDPRVDLMRMGAAFGEFGRTLVAASDADVDPAEKIAAIDAATPKIRAAVRSCLVPPDREKWDRVGEALGVSELGDLIRWMMSELSPLDPTQRPESSPGSDIGSGSSTDGAPPEG